MTQTNRTPSIETIADALCTQMDMELISMTAENPLQKALKSHRIVKRVFIQLNKTGSQFPFSSIEEEIHFFKHTLPKLWADLIYYTELYFLELKRPLTGNEKIESYLKDILNFYRQYFERHQQFYNYYRTEKTYHDLAYFSKSAADKEMLPPEEIIDSDSASFIGSVYSFKRAKFIALERLIEQIHFDIHCLNHPQLELVKSSELRWTDSKVALIELAYAIQSKGALNNGNSDVKTIISGLQHLFQIDLGNYYAVYNQNIRLRKKNRTDYLSQLMGALEKRMDDADEHPRFK
ncbi:RteC domain-containing protein [Arachidicoccus ginsenosidivorans]|jgi:hypothetical protein|uniref:Tetracycline regulation of excision, RteC n=1 Tax=Arachidicoccus ginsenosidivorans TaxID=496057 RepID=A0A5B8VSP0_9BACT|nr:RteC domain-containing protein [Arachidicoccus ginsenosidivorans]QEC73766.1 hypothetical protein FSB73_20945 [Arachidicoccus ginsenosidivorans]